jgi:hypothetical protein
VAVEHGERLSGGCVGSPQPSLHQPHPAWLPEQRNLAGQRLQVLFKLLPKPRLVAYVTSSIRDEQHAISKLFLQQYGEDHCREGAGSRRAKRKRRQRKRVEGSQERRNVIKY